MSYHVNPATGQAGKCRAVYECPFGTSEEHHEDAAQARQAYEQAMGSGIPLPRRKKVSIYRAGSLVPPTTYFGDLDSLLTAFDAHAPEGRQPRRGSIFASPDLRSHGRWVRGTNAAESHELKIDLESVYIYPVEAYEQACHEYDKRTGGGERFKEAVEEFWESGMKLSDWLQWSKDRDLPRGSWEIILTPEQAGEARPVSNRRIIE